MSRDAQDVATITMETTEPKCIDGSRTASDLSDFSAVNGNNVSFVNITYSVQEHPIKSLFKDIPRKTVLCDVRYVI